MSTPDAPLTDSPAYEPLTEDLLRYLAGVLEQVTAQAEHMPPFYRALLELRERRARDQAAAHDTRLVDLLALDDDEHGDRMAVFQMALTGQKQYDGWSETLREVYDLTRRHIAVRETGEQRSKP